MPVFITQPIRSLGGSITVPGDKSLSHRSLIFSAIAEGQSRVRNLLLGDDVLRTLTIINELGVKTSHTAGTISKNDEVVVEGVGLFGLKRPRRVLYCGNSATTMRLMLGLLSAQDFQTSLTGDASLNKRPMDRVTKPLERMGARFEAVQRKGQRVITVTGKRPLRAIAYHSPIASAQVKSAVLLAGLYTPGTTSVTEPGRSRNHTELMLKAMGAPVRVAGLTVFVSPPEKLRPLDVTVPGDISSAAFFIVAALLLPDSKLTIREVSLNPTRTGILDVLLKMGARIEITRERMAAGERVGDLTVFSSPLTNCDIGGEILPRLIDEIPILALAGACARGRMSVSGAGELRVKETDRIAAICSELKKLGVAVTEKDDGFAIEGTGTSGFRHPASGLAGYGDHRMAMMAVVAGSLLARPVEIDDVGCIDTSFPDFFELWHRVARPRDSL